MTFDPIEIVVGAFFALIGAIVFIAFLVSFITLAFRNIFK